MVVLINTPFLYSLAQTPMTYKPLISGVAVNSPEFGSIDIVPCPKGFVAEIPLPHTI